MLRPRILVTSHIAMSFFRKKTRIPASLHTVEAVDVARYCGTWYEAASIPRKRQKRCANTKAEYTLTPEGKVRVVNSCRRHGKTVSIKALGSPVSGSGNAWLKVRFFGIINADYRVIELAADYSWAVVSNTTGSGLWVLSRTPYPDTTVYDGIMEKLRSRGIETSGIEKTAQ
jgi:apolipoprotein D and lipocalin family protein